MTDLVAIPTLSEALDNLYAQYNRREYVHPDPLQFLYAYDDPRDREIVGLVASSLAYGRVAQILRSVSAVLELMPSPARFLEESTQRNLAARFAGFKHRFTDGVDLAGLLVGAKRAVEACGSLESAFARSLRDSDETVLPALTGFAARLNVACSCNTFGLVPSPRSGSACKRLNLYLRWMVRRDDVDPGGWNRVSPARLIVPLDTHMFRICKVLGMTKRNQADLRAALEVTAAFRVLSPGDPVKYDFALTRLGIRNDADAASFLRRCGLCEVA